jgi:hypothetical protein
VALKRKGNYWYGTSADDVWDYFVWWTRNSPEPVKHWQPAVCPCGGGVFTVTGGVDEGQYQRTCIGCETEVVLFAREWSRRKKPRPGLPDLGCICGDFEFEVVGVTAPFQGDEVSAKWFYLGMRCVSCGCLGCYADWIPRHTDARAFLALL